MTMSTAGNAWTLLTAEKQCEFLYQMSAHQGPQWTKNQHEIWQREIVCSLRSLFLPHKTKRSYGQFTQRDSPNQTEEETIEIYTGPLTNTFELPGSTDMLISFFLSPQYYRPWMNPEIGKCRYGRPTVKWHKDFQLCRRLALKPLLLFKGQHTAYMCKTSLSTLLTVSLNQFSQNIHCIYQLINGQTRWYIYLSNGVWSAVKTWMKPKDNMLSEEDSHKAQHWVYDSIYIKCEG